MNNKISIFVACDTSSTTTAKKIIKYTKTKKLKIGYKFGLEFFNSKNGRYFVSKAPTESAGINADIDTVQIAGVTNCGLYPNPCAKETRFSFSSACANKFSLKE